MVVMAGKPQQWVIPRTPWAERDLGAAVCPTCGDSFRRLGPVHTYCKPSCRPSRKTPYDRWRDTAKTGRKPGASCDPVKFDADLIRSAVKATGRPICRVSWSLGWNPGTLNTYILRGQCNYFALDELCTHLGLRIEEVAL